MKTILITEDISQPIDEGIKKFSFQLAKFCINASDENKVFSASLNKDIPFINSLPKNKLLFSPSFYRNLREHRPRKIIYVPAASSTLMSFLRLKLISLFSNDAQVIMVSVQERKHGRISKKLISMLKPHEVIVLSNKQASYYNGFGVNSRVSPVGVETGKFTGVSTDQKQRLRIKLGFPAGDKIALHVGHINKGRNLGALKKLVEVGFRVIIIGSTRFESDKEYQAQLEKEGFLFVNHYIEKVEEYYQAADVYVFPVQSAMSAMEFPLSVLEAMSCNLPVVTTRFGGIENFFSESEWFRYFGDEKDLPEIVQSFPTDAECNNRDKVMERFTWDQIFRSTFQTGN